MNKHVDKEHVHVVSVPDPYRGKYQGSGEETGIKYANEVKEAIQKAESKGRKVSTQMLLSSLPHPRWKTWRHKNTNLIKSQKSDSRKPSSVERQKWKPVQTWLLLALITKTPDKGIGNLSVIDSSWLKNVTSHEYEVNQKLNILGAKIYHL